MGVTVDIPGGQATFRSPGELTPRQRRPLKAFALSMGNQLQQVVQAAQVEVDGQQAAADPALAGVALSLSRGEAEAFMDMQDALTFALLESWTLPRPLPDTADALLDLPNDLYEALSAAAAKVQAADTDAGFTVDAVEDPNSPTGA